MEISIGLGRRRFRGLGDSGLDTEPDDGEGEGGETSSTSGSGLRERRRLGGLSSNEESDPWEDGSGTVEEPDVDAEGSTGVPQCGDAGA